MLPLRHGIRGAPSPKVPNHTARCVIQLIVRSSQKCEQWSSSKIASCLCCTHGYLCLTIQKLSLQNITPAWVLHPTGSASQVRESAQGSAKKTHTIPYPLPLPKQPLLYRSWRSNQDCLLA
jgi:hypothetical protein